ncbi:uncharacterized protein LACBIDRAFT_311357 [Laccaria bicolor S238N-H82]|uniref:Predicted protein n=1 Tax=Laccaria bicolor (strain S238N-H82 / ATCC MYA-4686) TaxID=486041 RepID=B0CZU1_LACBS|nr:uncharacterized protein LACBIDRAFT_311357 [Laccaria bicolor S238N-H82]EDR12676.1 predicted protein [Laccaria bicolor S238N-H82]|eukprot:XP_001876940.1 predicted protein [Laccaria bicolor S238N-H82]
MDSAITFALSSFGVSLHMHLISLCRCCINLISYLMRCIRVVEPESTTDARKDSMFLSPAIVQTIWMEFKVCLWYHAP